MAIKLLIVMEHGVEGVYDFHTKAEANAFESGFGMASGLLGSPSWDIFSREDDGEWQGDDVDEPKKMNDTIEQARKQGYEV